MYLCYTPVWMLKRLYHLASTDDRGLAVVVQHLYDIRHIGCYSLVLQDAT